VGYAEAHAKSRASRLARLASTAAAIRARMAHLYGQGLRVVSVGGGPGTSCNCYPWTLTRRRKAILVCNHKPSDGGTGAASDVFSHLRTKIRARRRLGRTLQSLRATTSGRSAAFRQSLTVAPTQQHCFSACRPIEVRAVRISSSASSTRSAYLRLK
jgi:hypothetical protein